MEKSRTFRTERLSGRRVNLLLFGAVIVVLIIVGITQIHRIVDAYERSRRTDISISPQFRSFFGNDIATALIQEFEGQYPDLKIQESSQSAPDILFFDDREIGGLIETSALASLDPYHHEWTARWALPLVSFMDIFVYNIDLLQAANRDRPPKTRVEFLAAARAVAESEEPVFAYALGLHPEDSLALRRELYSWVWANGGDIHAVDSREVKDTIAFLGQLHREKLLAPGTFEKTGAERLAEFAQGKIAMMTASARDIAYLRNNAQNINFGITAMPTTAPSKNRLGLLHIYAGISSVCALPDEAWTFLAFLAGKNHIFAGTLNAVPGRFPRDFPGEYIAKDSLYAKAWDIFEAADIVEHHLPNEETDRALKEQLAEVFN
jgi:ABC-type glycerol-3-phosphate transport system substrate-binding protein